MTITANWYAAAVTAVCVLLNSGTLVIYSGSQPTAGAAPSGTVLATLTFAATAFGTPSGTPPVASAGTIGSGTAAATGTAGFFTLVESGGTVVGTGTCGASGSGADLILSTTSIVSGATVSCSSFTVTG